MPHASDRPILALPAAGPTATGPFMSSVTGAVTGPCATAAHPVSIAAHGTATNRRRPSPFMSVSSSGTTARRESRGETGAFERALEVHRRQPGGPVFKVDEVGLGRLARRAKDLGTVVRRELQPALPGATGPLQSAGLHRVDAPIRRAQRVLIGENDQAHRWSE